MVIVSPEILNNDARFEDLWGTKNITDKLINLVLDEAHVVKEWGGTFRSDYFRIGPIRYWNVLPTYSRLDLYTLLLTNTTEYCACCANHSYGSLTIW